MSTAALFTVVAEAGDSLGHPPPVESNQGNPDNLRGTHTRESRPALRSSGLHLHRETRRYLNIVLTVMNYQLRIISHWGKKIGIHESIPIINREIHRGINRERKRLLLTLGC